MHRSKLLCALTFIAGAAACDSSTGAASAETSKDVVAQDGPGVLAQYRLVVGDFEAASNSPECVALRSKILAKRKIVQGGSEWRTIAETAQLKQIDNLEAQFRDANCKASDPTATPACSNINDALLREAEALAKTPQWKTLGNNEHWHDLLNDFNKAREIDCL